MAQPNLTLSGSPPPARLGRYLLGRELGRGFSSVVYEATDPLRNRRVALKVLTYLQNLSPARRQDLAERFEREARAISTLAHPSIVAIYEVGHAEDGRQFIAMEYLEGETLRDRLRRMGTLPAAGVLPLTIQIADALQYAHGRGIVHRDVKPDNVFVCPDGTAKLMDFGVAHVFADEGLTQTGTVVGSPAYMSPEQINGRRLDGRSDVFSLAITLAEALTGHRPFEAPNIPAVMNQILHRPPQLTDVTSRPLRKVLERALAKKPEARLASPAAFAAELRRVLPPLSAAPLSLAGSPQATVVMPLPPAARPHPARRTAWAAPALAAMLGVAALAALPFALHHRSAPTTLVMAPSAAHAGRVYHISSRWHRRPTATRSARRRHTRHGLGQGPREAEARITETFTHPIPAPPAPMTAETTAVLRALRNQPPVAVTEMPRPVAPAPIRKAHRRPAVSPFHVAAALPIAPPLVRTKDTQEERRAPATVPNDSPPPDPVPADRYPYGTGADSPDESQAPRASDVPDAGPRIVHWSAPIYPSGALSRREQGTVHLRVFVNEEGRVDDATVTESSGSLALDDAAIATVLHWAYEPAVQNGRAIPSTVREHVTFDLH